MSKQQFVWTEHQTEIFSACTQNLDTSFLLVARAGASKTTTLVETVCRLVGEASVKPHAILALAFNKKIAETLASKMPPGVVCSTLNALGHRALNQFLPHGRLAVSAWKEANLWRDNCPAFASLDKPEQRNIVEAYTRLKIGGLCPTEINSECFPPEVQAGHLPKFLETLVPLNQHAIEAAFVENLADLSMELDPRDWVEPLREIFSLDLLHTYLLGSISFLDQLYIPAICKSVSIQTYPHVLVDEAQDLGALEHALLRKVVSRFPKGRLIAVGDPAQAIYAFKGAHHDSMDRLGATFNATLLNLPVSFRCPRAVVAEAQTVCPSIEPWDKAAEGKVEHLTEWSLTTLPRPATLLCRMNYPLIQAGLALIQAGIGAHFLARNFEEELQSFFSTWRKRSRILPGMFLAIEQEIRALESKDKHKANRLDDYAKCLRAVSEQFACTTFEELEQGIRILFNSPGPITLASVHKAKGLEWPRVYLLRPDLCPKPDVVDPDELQQELNIRYVAITRAQESFGYLYKQE